MRKRVSLQRLVTLSVLSLDLLAATFSLAYAYWQAKHSLRTTIGLTFQELARQSADKVSLILDKEVEWVERLAATPEVVEAVSIGTRPTFDRPAFQRWRDTQLRYFRSKDADHAEFLRIIRATHRGERLHSPFMADGFAQRAVSALHGAGFDASAGLPLLTERKREILAHAASG